MIHLFVIIGFAVVLLCFVAVGVFGSDSRSWKQLWKQLQGGLGWFVSYLVSLIALAFLVHYLAGREAALTVIRYSNMGGVLVLLRPAPNLVDNLRGLFFLVLSVVCVLTVLFTSLEWWLNHDLVASIGLGALSAMWIGIWYGMRIYLSWKAHSVTE